MYSDNENTPLIPMENFYFENFKDEAQNHYQISQPHQNHDLSSRGYEKLHSGASDSFMFEQMNYNENDIATPPILQTHPSTNDIENMNVTACQNFQDSLQSASQCNNQNQLLQTAETAMKLSEFLILKPRQNNDVMGKKHRAHISLVPTPTGIKTIVKRKRKRTIFTTEQVETLEGIFKLKPYINSDDRKVLVEMLQVSDKTVKVWFQNRRLKGKRNEQMAIEEMREEESSPDLTRLDYVESQINEKTDEFGYVTLDDEVMSDLVKVIDNFLSDSERLEVSSCDRSDVLSYAGSSPIYEPISPASVTDCSEEENPHQWQPNEPKESLQRLFDLQYLVPY